MKKTTLCYISHQDRLLMILRNKKKNDVNKEKYIGLGGHFLEGESPQECVIREVYEESGIMLEHPHYRGIVNFYSDVDPSEQMHLFTDTLNSAPPLPNCEEGTLCFVEKKRLFSLNMWEGDRIFLSLLFEDAPFFILDLYYQKDRLARAILNGKEL